MSRRIPKPEATPFQRSKFELRQLANAQGFLGGVAVDRNHNVYVCNASGHRMNRVTQKGEISVYCDRAPDGPLVTPNYGSFDAKGNYYFSDSGDYWKPNGRSIRVRPDGRSESLIGGNWHFPNGLAISPKDGAVLNQPTNVAFEPKGTRLFFANLGGAHVGAFDVGESGAPLPYPKL